ncbi:MAG: XdhC family protein [Myxococcales bacterium]|nr:XdhC family protein [Myxococcales bacterium]
MSIDIPELVHRARGAAAPMYLATVVHTQGPCYRKTGARLLVGSQGRLAGGVSGGCLERDLVRRIAWMTEDGARVETFDTSADGDESERSYLGCGGTIRVLLERADPHALATLGWVAEQDGPCAVVSVLESHDPACRVGTSYAVSDTGRYGEPVWSSACEPLVRACLEGRAHLHRDLATEGGDLRVLIEYVAPPRHLLVAGRHYDTAPLVQLAKDCGWRVCVAAEHTAEDLGAPHDRIELSGVALRGWLGRHPNGAMVIMTHSVPLDRLCIEHALRSGELAYVGLLGPSERADKLLAAIEERAPLPEQARSRLRAPAGLALGGEGARAIALSIVAELEQCFARRVPVI